MAALQPAVKKECKKILICVSIGAALTILVFFLLNLIFPEDVPFDYTVITGSISGSFVAFLNFYLMCLTVQKVAADPSNERARNRMKLSYTYRYLMQIAWIVIAILVPCFNPVAGIIPLVFPSFGIKLRALFSKPEPSATVQKDCSTADNPDEADTYANNRTDNGADTGAADIGTADTGAADTGTADTADK